MFKRVLIVDDDPVTHTIVKGVLDATTQFIGFFSLKEAEDYLNSNELPSLVIIDRVLPDGDGLNLCAKIRSDSRLQEIPIIFLSSKIDETDKVGGLFAGADDYVCKPVSPLELKARIQARLRSKSQKIRLGNLVIELATHRVFQDFSGKLLELELTRIEFKMLILMAKFPDRIFSRDAILTGVWGLDAHVSDRVVDTHISHLRKKILQAGVAVQAIRGEGYKMIADKDKKNQAA